MAKGKELKKLKLELEGLKSESKKLGSILQTVTEGYAALASSHTGAIGCTLALASGAQRELGESGVEATSTKSTSVPVIVVLVDGRSHLFHDELYQDTARGPVEAAKALRIAIRDRLAAMMPAVINNKVRLVVKIFASLKTISDVVAMPKGPRALATWFAVFTGIYPLFDFVDVSEEKFIPLKISENYELYMANEACKHVFFAAAAASKYYDLLRPYGGQINKVTLVNGSVSDAEIHQLGLHAISFPKLFKFGRSRANASKAATDPAPSAVASAQMTTGNPATLDASNPATSPVGVGSAPKSIEPSTSSSLLPTQHYDGRVPVNSANQRLDIQSQLPTRADLQAYKERCSLVEPCTDIHLRGQCNNTDCMRSHGAVTPGVLCVMRFKAMGTQCSKGSVCRDLNCVNAHICQQLQCARVGGRANGCGFTEEMHHVDPQVDEWVMADDAEGESGAPVQRMVLEGAEALADRRPVFSAAEELLLSS